MSDKLETELDVKIAELAIKKQELEQKKATDAKAWQRVIAAPLAIAVLVALVSGLISLLVERTKIKSSGENGKFAREHALLLAVDQPEPDQRKKRLCQFAYSNSFQHDDTRAILDEFLKTNTDCNATGIASVKAKPTEAKNELEQCIAAGTVKRSSCRAYDKSGFHSRPSKSCTIELPAGEDRFFAKSQVKVIDEFYRKRSGAPASEAVKPVAGSDAIRAFSGKISCTNSRGTGRTCEARATVELVSYPNSCMPFKEELAKR